MEFQIKQVKPINCFYANLSEIFSFYGNDIKEYELFFVSGIECRYHSSNMINLEDNFMFNDDRLIIEKICTKYNFKSIVMKNNMGMQLKNFICSSLLNKEPLLFLVDSKGLEYQTPAIYYQKVPAKHVIIAYDYEEESDMVSIVDTYTNDAVPHYALMSMHKIMDIIFTAILVRPKNDNSIKELDMKAEIKHAIGNLLDQTTDNSFYRLNNFFDDFRHLNTLGNSEFKSQVLKLLYLIEIRFFFVNQYIIEIAKISDFSGKTKEELIKSAESTAELWIVLFKNMLISIYSRVKNIDRIIAAGKGAVRKQIFTFCLLLKELG